MAATISTMGDSSSATRIVAGITPPNRSVPVDKTVAVTIDSTYSYATYIPLRITVSHHDQSMRHASRGNLANTRVAPACDSACFTAFGEHAGGLSGTACTILGRVVANGARLMVGAPQHPPPAVSHPSSARPPPGGFKPRPYQAVAPPS